jgi:hypothetical protein
MPNEEPCGRSCRPAKESSDIILDIFLITLVENAEETQPSTGTGLQVAEDGRPLVEL